MKKFLLFIIICFPLICSGQGIRQSFTGTNKNTKLVLSTPTMKPGAASPSKSSKPVAASSNKPPKGKNPGRTNNDSKMDSFEYVLYRNIVRQHTWLVGQGEPITQEVANHLPFYYRLSMKNDKGHWQHIEAMHGDTLTTHHDQSPYFINKAYDSKIADKDWYAKVDSIAQWFITGNLTGDIVVEERAYTKDGDMIYGFIPTQNDKSHITGSYIDAWGFPVDMNENEENTYGSVVYITYDEQGGDSIIDYLDGEGYRKPNSNGVDQERTVYDDKMRPTLRTSHNCVGDYMIDNWGNCGNIYEYAPDGKSYTITRVDDSLKPMRMPELRADATETYVKCKVLLDEWGRQKERIMLTEDNVPDSTLSGIHRIVYHYAKNGKNTSKIFYDINGNEIK